MIRVYECSYKHCRLETKKSFRLLNFGEGGNMIRVIRGLQGKKHEEPREDTRVVYAKDGDTIIGWAVLVDPPMVNCDGTEVYFYVTTKHRRQGIGTMLMKAARKHWGPEFKVCRHDNTSTLFFDKVTPNGDED